MELDLVHRVRVKPRHLQHDELLAARRADGNRDSPAESTVELLTAIRRAQGRPVPVAVVANLPGEVESVFPNLPVVDVTLVNRDFQKSPVTITFDGEYRTVSKT